jgi:hypothetical protein
VIRGVCGLGKWRNSGFGIIVILIFELVIRKVLGCRIGLGGSLSNTHIALTKALLDACQYCADPADAEIRHILAKRLNILERPLNTFNLHQKP